MPAEKSCPPREHRQWSQANTELARSERKCRRYPNLIGLLTSAWFIRERAHLSELVHAVVSRARFMCCGVVMSSHRQARVAGRHSFDPSCQRRFQLVRRPCRE